MLAPVTFPIPPPEGMRLDKGFNVLAISPDGRKVAFVAGPENAPLLWICYLNGLTAMPLPGTEGAVSPFWSPDSRSIGFYSADDKIKRVGIAANAAGDGHVSSGLPMIVTELAPQGSPGYVRAACWTSDDKIIFEQPNGLMRVDANGGKPSRVTMLDPSRAEVAHSLPSALPNGRFLYVAHSKHDVFQAKVGGIPGQPDAIVPGVQTNVVFVSDYLVFRQEDALVAQPFDDRTLRLTGEPLILADGVSYNPANARSVFAASPDVFVYRSRIPERLTRFDRRGGDGSIGEIGRDGNPVIAPDGSGRIAVERSDPLTHSSQIYVIDDQGRSTLLGYGVSNRFPVWSPDAKSLMYRANGASGNELHVVRSDGTDDHVVYRGDHRSTRLVEERIRPLCCRQSYAARLWALPVNGEDRTPLQLTDLSGDKTTGRFSPDGSWIARGSTSEGRPDFLPGATHVVSNIWIQRFPTGANKLRISIDGGLNPSWRQDGRELYYMTSDGWIMAVPVQLPTNPDDPVKVGNALRLFKIDPANIAQALHPYAASPDGQHFVAGVPMRERDNITVMVNWMSRLRR